MRAKKLKRIFVTASIDAGDGRRHRFFERFTNRYSPLDAAGVAAAESAVRHRFARKRGVDPATVTIESAPEKLNYAPRGSFRSSESSDDYNGRRAIAYAEWLAARDGIALPNDPRNKPRPVWSGIYSATKTRPARAWQTEPQATYCRRVCAVEWGIEGTTEHFNTRKDGRRGAWSHNEKTFDVMARVEIPNWDFEPAAPVEESIPDDVTAPASVARACRVPARFLSSSRMVRPAMRFPVAPRCAIRLAA